MNSDRDPSLVRSVGQLGEAMAQPGSPWRDGLAKHGPWALMAGACAFALWLTVIKPAASAQEATAKDRTRLLDAITATMEQNSKSMAGMAAAVEKLNQTLVQLNNGQDEMSKSLKDFTKGVTDCHESQHKKLDEIKAKLDEP